MLLGEKLFGICALRKNQYCVRTRANRAEGFKRAGARNFQRKIRIA